VEGLVEGLVVDRAVGFRACFLRVEGRSGVLGEEVVSGVEAQALATYA
jgi:hypothetical protein